MASEQSYTITKSNNATEKEAINYILAKESNFILPDKESRNSLMKLFGIEKKFSRAFDLVYIQNIKPNNTISIQNKNEIIFIELKTTKKYLPNNPKGFFFGATENEFNLAKKLGDSYKFCFISLHKDSLSHAILTLTELEKIIKTKRIQFQINI